MKYLTVTTLLQMLKAAVVAVFPPHSSLGAVVVVEKSAAKIACYRVKTFFLAKNLRKNVSNIAVTTVTTVTFIFLNLIKDRTSLSYSLVTPFFKPP